LRSREGETAEKLREKSWGGIAFEWPGERSPHGKTGGRVSRWGDEKSKGSWEKGVGESPQRKKEYRKALKLARWGGKKRNSPSFREEKTEKRKMEKSRLAGGGP